VQGARLDSRDLPARRRRSGVRLLHVLLGCRLLLALRSCHMRDSRRKAVRLRFRTWSDPSCGRPNLKDDLHNRLLRRLRMNAEEVHQQRHKHEMDEQRDC
jgi:hypothetical protein